MVKLHYIRITYKKKLVLEMKLQPGGKWTMRKGSDTKRRPKKKASSHFKKLKNAYGRYLNR